MSAFERAAVRQRRAVAGVARAGGVGALGHGRAVRVPGKRRTVGGETHGYHHRHRGVPIKDQPGEEHERQEEHTHPATTAPRSHKPTFCRNPSAARAVEGAEGEAAAPGAVEEGGAAVLEHEPVHCRVHATIRPCRACGRGSASGAGVKVEGEVEAKRRVKGEGESPGPVPPAPTSQCEPGAEHDAEGSADQADHLEAHRATRGHEPAPRQQVVRAIGDVDLDNAVVGEPRKHS